MREPYRAALYYAPEETDPLWRAGCAWLGRDAQSGAPVAQPTLPGLPPQTRAPRRYGFHATLKAPFIPFFGFEIFLKAAEHFAARQASFPLPRLQVMNLRGFLALCPAAPCLPLRQLADACVTELDQHRTPEDEAAQTRRAEGRPPSQVEHIRRWGYPLVFDEFRFHMTLTDKMDDNPYEPAASAYFAPALACPRMVNSLAIFVEDEKGAPFRLYRRLAFAP
ncbi:DUF1045 domain-containing protein [Acidocella sp.]|uniref:DUF1045 domain-containing protein n=1 Tax=Acidocella sp. TaxID=50710 RepID=UPI003CFFE660